MLKLVNDETPELTDVVFRFPRGLDRYQFESRAEYACAALLEKYVPGWTCETFKTYQIPIGFNRKVDFRVGDTLVEYHPIVFSREFDDRVAYRQFDHAIRKIPAHWRHQIKESIFNEFLERYYKKRRFVIDANPELKHLDFVVVHSPQTFYHSVLKRFGQDVPKLKEIVREFGRLQRST